MKKKVDSRIRQLVEAGVKLNQRSLFVIVGDKGRDQVIHLHYMLSKLAVKARPSVLWCYKKELGFSTHRKKRMREINKMKERGLMDEDSATPFELFLSTTSIRFAYYRESHKIIGNTFGMCVLQDFEALTPNLLARTVETVEGGGVVVLLLRTMSSLKQLYSLSMDVHAHFTTEAHKTVRARFNERFILSLAHCHGSLVVDDELNILPLSSPDHTQHVEPKDKEKMHARAEELKQLKASLKDTQPIGALVDMAGTVDQAKAVLTFVEAISEKTLRNTVTLTAARGRGKSAALGIAIAGALAYGYANIFVTAPSPENLRTLFDFVFRALDALDWKEHTDYTLVRSTQPDLKDTVVRVNVFRSHRQTIQYIRPQDAHVLSQAELVVIDEAAAIPLPLVKSLLGPYLVFMSSTINGYEGTGRSLSLKLISQLRKQSANAEAGGGEGEGSGAGVRVLREIELEQPLRYALGDGIEAWLNDLLCLDAAKALPRLFGAPHPSKCSLFWVDRDTLFSHRAASEAFLQRMMALFVASHYKNSPNDLQLMSDAPAHQLFALLGPQQKDSTDLPDILCVVQVCLEGGISHERVQSELGRGQRSSGDLIPWTLSQQFQDDSFAGLSGVRVVRIAVHPDMMHMGYGSRALDELHRFFAGQLASLAETPLQPPDDVEPEAKAGAGGKGSRLLSESLKPRPTTRALLQPLSQRTPPALHWVGTSFGVTQELFQFWNKSGYAPVYLRQTPNDLTGEHTCIMLKSLAGDDAPVVPANPDWLSAFHADFLKRFRNLLSFQFRTFSCAISLTILSPVLDLKKVDHALTAQELGLSLSAYDLRRIELYSRNLVDHHLITDTVPAMAHWVFAQRVPVSLSYTQGAILAGVGLQRKAIEDVAAELGFPVKHALALFNKLVRKLSKHFDSLAEAHVGASMPRVGEASVQRDGLSALPESLAESLGNADKEARQDLAARQQALLDESGLGRFAVQGDDEEWDKALPKSGGVVSSVSVKSNKDKDKDTDKDKGKHNGKDKKRKHGDKDNASDGTPKRRKSGGKKFKNLS